MRSWQSGAAISPTIRTGSSPPPSSTGGQLSAKTLPVEVFIRRWYDKLYGEDGNDTLYACDGEKDELCGGAGADVFYADDGIDVICDYTSGEDIIIWC